MSEESKGQYGTFQGTPNYAQPAVGFPQPVPPPGLTAAHHPPPPPPEQSGPTYFARGYHAVPVHGYYAPVVEGRPVRLPRLLCCGLGIGWLLFMSGFFLAAIPWYVGAFILLCVRVDYREKPGLVACTVADMMDENGFRALQVAILTAFVITVAEGHWEFVSRGIGLKTAGLAAIAIIIGATKGADVW